MNAFTESTAFPLFVCVRINFRPWNLLAHRGVNDFSAQIETALCNALDKQGIIATDQPAPHNDFTRGKFAAALYIKASQAIGLFEVTDWRLAIPVIRDTLARLGLLTSAQIGWHDESEGIIRYILPRPSEELFQPVIETLIQWLKDAQKEFRPNRPAPPV
jgi:hypothetical protein